MLDIRFFGIYSGIASIYKKYIFGGCLSCGILISEGALFGLGHEVSMSGTSLNGHPECKNGIVN